MKLIYLILAFIFTIIGLGGCEKDLEKAFISEHAPQILLNATLFHAMGNEFVLQEDDADTAAIRIEWSKPQYLSDTLMGNIAFRYELLVDLDESFPDPYKIDGRADQDTVLNVRSLNNILIDLGASIDVVQEVSICIRSISSTDTVMSDTFTFSAAPYAVYVAPKIAVPETLYITGGALPWGWITPFPDSQRFEKVNTTSFSLTISLLGGQSYELITDVNGNVWTPCYRIAPSESPAQLIYGGSFVEDGDGSPYNWSGQMFMSPPQDGLYEITFDFQRATFTVEKQ